MLVFGDLNARTGKELLDYIIDDNVEVVGFQVWNGTLQVIFHAEGNQKIIMLIYLVEHYLCKKLDVHIVNGRSGYDCGNYTFISSQGKSLIDYVLASPSLFKYILDFFNFNNEH